jgi:hypothetical protein
MIIDHRQSAFSLEKNNLRAGDLLILAFGVVEVQILVLTSALDVFDVDSSKVYKMTLSYPWGHLAYIVRNDI